MRQRRLVVPFMIALCAAAVVAGCGQTGSRVADAGSDGPGSSVLLVGNKSAASLWRLDMVDGRQAGEVATGQGPHEIAVAPDRSIAVVADYGSGDTPGNTLTVLDLESGAVSSVSLGTNARPHGLRFLPGGRRLVATTEGSDALVVVDLDAGQVERAIAIGPGKGHMVALSADGAIAYVTKVGSGQLVRVDLAAALGAADAAGHAAAVREAPAGAGAEGVDVAPDGTVWVSNREAGTVTVHDPETLDVVAMLDSPGFPIRVTFTADGLHALVTNARAATLGVFSVRDRAPVAVVPLAEPGVEYRETMLGRAALPIGAIADPDGSRVYVAISGGNQVAVVDTAKWKVVQRWPTGNEPDALAIVPAGARQAAP